jgi:transcriptional regulator
MDEEMAAAVTTTALTPRYPPAHHQETRRDVLIDFVRRNAFGMLITTPGGLNACGVPFVLVEDRGTLILEAHLARANPAASADGCAALALFQGPHAYVRPAWYETWKRDGKAVPTWDYIMVQAKGTLSVIDDPAWLTPRLEALTAEHEGAFPDPWSPRDPSDGYVDRLARGIVGARMEVRSLDGVWKLHQNHPQENRLGVVAGLEAVGSPDAAGVARAILALDEDDG